jgi:hypothetical protein
MHFATRVRTWRVARLYSVQCTVQWNICISVQLVWGYGVLLVCTVYSVLYSEISVSRKPLGIGHMYIHTFCTEWPILSPPNWPFPLGHSVYIRMVLISVHIVEPRASQCHSMFQTSRLISWKHKLFMFYCSNYRNNLQLIDYLPLIRHGPQRKWCVQTRFYCCVCIRRSGNAFTEPLPSTDRIVTHTDTDWWEGFMKHAVEMDSGAMIYIWSFIKIGSGIQKLMGWGDELRHRQHGDRISLFYFSQNKERKITEEMGMSCSI